jgi:2-oxoisovalerate dehydrogenase E1 component
MLLSRRIDDKEIQLKNQSLTYFQISGAGHEAILVAAGLALRPGHDWFYPYYRDRALCLTLGVTPLAMFLASVGSKDDHTSGGRQMPSHWGDRDLHIVSQSSATGTQCVQAVGCAEAAVLYSRLDGIPDRERRYETDEVTYVSIGDGATSEGEFWESLNVACLHRLPVLFLVEDNGYAISVPVEAQTPGGSISRLVQSFPNLHVGRCDGTDVIESYRAMTDAVEWCRERRGPALVHATVIRPYSHSHSDDERAYKTPAERAAESTRDPLTRFAEFLTSHDVVTPVRLKEIAADVDREVADAAAAALKAPRPDPATAALYVYSPDVDPSSSSFDTPVSPEGSPDTMVAAINRTLKDEMAGALSQPVRREHLRPLSGASDRVSVDGRGRGRAPAHGDPL